ncbi:MAG TPA: hypothetical protein VIM67_09980 [Terriglobus sp.]
MAKQRGTPDQRGMGAQSDFLSETFVPSAAHRKKQMEHAAVLLRLGYPIEQIAVMVSVPVEELELGLPEFQI